ncbi:hypothetical protein AB0K52_04750 [Glycomyces sp. NPDC049804]|uniref:hypothetical protein n=1 Tax=Glycomyces sp. NPDC049804 TaxID=3154363 RepID=UPI003440F88B
MQNRHTNAGAPGPVQSAALSIRKWTRSQASGLLQRSSIWAVRLGAVIATVFGLLKDKATPVAASLAGRLRETAAPAVERAGRLIAWASLRLQPWTALLKDLAVVAAESARPVVAPAVDLGRRLVAKVVDRFGMRMTVMGAATAIFIGSTGSAAMAITNLDTESAVQAQNGVAAAEVALSEESASAAAESIAEDQRAAAAAEAAEAAKEAAEPKPVGGLSKLQMSNAVAIIEAGKDEGLDQKAWAIALATAMQESKFRNYANVNVAESYDYEYQAEGSDHDSVGLFQQRPSSGWGSVKELMDPKTSASKFYNSLKRVDGWENMPVTKAAQTVQVSAFPDAYAQWEDLAWDIIDAYNAR